MPVRSLRPCSVPLCPELVEGGKCAKHQAETIDYSPRPSASARGYTYRWQQESKRYLRANPLCVHCLARDVITASQHVDHKIPVIGPDDPNFWNPENWQALCHSCHSVKTATEDGGFGNTQTPSHASMDQDARGHTILRQLMDIERK